jgi:hypothetical protein
MENDRIAQPNYVVARSKNFENQSEKKSKTIPFDSIRFVRSRGHCWSRSENFDKSMRHKQIRFYFIATS